jgi:integrase
MPEIAVLFPRRCATAGAVHPTNAITSHGRRTAGQPLTFAAKAHVVPVGFNPCRGIEYFPEEGRERYLTTPELAQIGEAIREAETIGLTYTVDETKPKAKHAPKEGNRRTVIGPHAAAALRLLVFTGARLREILHLKWEHVDFERATRTAYQKLVQSPSATPRASSDPITPSSLP